MAKKLRTRPNNDMQRTRIQQAFYQSSSMRAADAGRSVASGEM
jgi:hypothetical protein